MAGDSPETLGGMRFEAIIDGQKRTLTLRGGTRAVNRFVPGFAPDSDALFVALRHRDQHVFCARVPRPVDGPDGNCVNAAVASAVSLRLHVEGEVAGNFKLPGSRFVAANADD